MTWSEILGHEHVIDRFRRCAARGRLASTFLFVGPPGIGKRTFAVKLAQALLCERSDESDLEACGECPSCQQVAADSHPDLELIAKPADKSFIPIELFIGDRDHRMREGMCHNISLKPFRGGKKIAIIDDADYLNQEGANCLLKTLEEPPPKSVIILIGSSEQRQLPTIRSRCQIIRFRPLAQPLIEELLREHGYVDSPDDVARIAEIASGSLERAFEFRDPESYEFREQLMRRLGQSDWNRQTLIGDVTGYIDEAGKDTALKRDRMRKVIGLAAEFYRAALRDVSGAEPPNDRVLQDALDTFRRRRQVHPEMAADCLDRCVDAHAHVDANANPATLIECWIDDLATRSRP